MNHKPKMKAPRLHLIMPASRPRNIEKLIAHYMEQMEPHPFELRWYLPIQGPEPDPKGMHKVNEMLDQIEHGWVMTLADDTYQEPSLFRRLGELIDKHPGAGVFVFRENRGTWQLAPTPENMRPCHVDGGQVIWARWFIASDRFDYEAHKEQADGYFIQRKFSQYPALFVFVDEMLVNFGRLEWPD